jgi:hypothetical protein
MGSQTGPFAFFDRTYLINSAKQTRRLKHVSARLSRLNIEFERFEAVTPISNEGRADKPSLKPGHYAAAPKRGGLNPHGNRVRMPRGKRPNEEKRWMSLFQLFTFSAFGNAF